MPLKRRTFTAEFKLRAVREADAATSLAVVARKYEIHPNLLTKWRTAHHKRGPAAFTSTVPRTETKVAELERLIGQLTVENAFLKNVLARLEAERSGL